MKFSRTIMLGGVLLSASAAHASIPSVSSKCSKRLPAVIHPDNATGVIFDDECTTAFVLPPETGTAKMAALAKNANLQFCPAVLKAGTTALTLADSSAKVAERIEKMIDDYEPARQELDAATDDLDAKEAEGNRLQALVAEAEGRKGQALADLAAIKGDLETCQVLGNDCTELLAQKKQAELDFLAVKREYDSLNQQKIAQDAQVSRARAKKLSLESQYTAATANLTSLLGSIETINTSIAGLYKQWAPVEGATSQLLYRVNWSDLLKSYQAENGKLTQQGIQFVPVPVVDGKFFATTKFGSEADLASIPAVLSAVVPGAIPYGLSHVGENITKAEASDTDASNPQAPSLNENMLNYSASAVSGGGASVSGQVRLSLAGACPYFPEGLASVRNEIDEKDLAAHMVVNAQLTYDVKAHRKYAASFNMSKMVERIEEISKKKRWFFTSEDAHKLIVNTDAKSWFDIKFDNDSSDFNFTEAEQTKLANEVKADLVKRALDQIAVVTGKIPAVPDMGKTGYEQTPGLPCNIWFCSGLTWALSVADGFFGTKTATSQYKEVNKSWTSDSVSQVKVLRRSQILTFDPKK